MTEMEKTLAALEYIRNRMETGFRWEILLTGRMLVINQEAVLQLD